MVAGTIHAPDVWRPDIWCPGPLAFETFPVWVKPCQDIKRLGTFGGQDFWQLPFGSWDFWRLTFGGQDFWHIPFGGRDIRQLVFGS